MLAAPVVAAEHMEGGAQGQLDGEVVRLRDDVTRLREELLEERHRRLLLEERLRSLLPPESSPREGTSSLSGGTSAVVEALSPPTTPEGPPPSSSTTLPSLVLSSASSSSPSSQSVASPSSQELHCKPSFKSLSSVRRGAPDQQSPQQEQEERWMNMEKRLASLEEQVWALSRQQGQLQPAASGLLSNLLARVDDKSKLKRRTTKMLPGSMIAEAESDDETGLFDLSPQEVAELKERVANRSVHAIVKESNLSMLRVKVAENIGLINLKDEEGQTPLHVACVVHPANMDIVRFLLANNSDVNAVDHNGWTPLHAACKNAHGNGDLIRLLLNNGAEAALANADETRPIHYFARQNLGPEHMSSFNKALNLLLAKGADLNHANRYGETALHNAVMYASNEVAFLLFAHKTANLQLRNVYGETVLNYAIRSYKKEVVEKLLDMGMDPRLPDDRSNKTALQVAASLGSPAKDIFNVLKARASALDMKDMTPEQKSRYRMNLAIEEIVSTENEYLQDLRVLISVYVEPLKKNQQDDSQPVKILSKMEMQSIFGNVEQIYKVASDFVQDLPDMSVNWQANDPPRIGKIFLKHMKAFQVYEKVCVHQHISTEWLDRALGKDERDKKGRVTPFAEFCDKAKQLKACRKLDLAAFLIKPFQRITKYPLLIREVLGYSDESYADYQDLKRAQEEFNAIINGANEKKRISDNLQSIIKIQSRIEWPAQSLVNSMVPLLAKKGRTLTAKADMQVSLNSERFAARHVYLFSDALVIVQRIKKEKKTKKKFLFVCQLLFETASVIDIKDGSVENGKQLKACFSMEDSKHKVLLCCSSEMEKLEWFDHVSKGIELARSMIQLDRKDSIQEAIRNAKPGEKGTSTLAALHEMNKAYCESGVIGGTGGSGTTLAVPMGSLHRRDSSGPSSVRAFKKEEDSSEQDGPKQEGTNEGCGGVPAAMPTDHPSSEEVVGDGGIGSSGQGETKMERAKKKATGYLGSLPLPRFGSGDEASTRKKKKKKENDKDLRKGGSHASLTADT